MCEEKAVSEGPKPSLDVFAATRRGIFMDQCNNQEPGSCQGPAVFRKLVFEPKLLGDEFSNEKKEM